MTELSARPHDGGGAASAAPPPVLQKPLAAPAPQNLFLGVIPRDMPDRPRWRPPSLPAMPRRAAPAAESGSLRTTGLPSSPPSRRRTSIGMEPRTGTVAPVV